MKKNILYLFIVINVFFYSNTAISKVVTNKIFIGKATSLTGKNSSNALIFNDQHDIDIKNINNTNGVEVGGKSYQFEIIYYDDESNNFRTNNLIKRLILNDGIQFIIIPYNLELYDSVKDIIKKSQRPLIIFPQGTRVKPNERPPFKKGVARIYEELRISCQPVAINSGQVWPKKGSKKANKIITISILKSISAGLQKEKFLQILEKDIYSELDLLD